MSGRVWTVTWSGQRAALATDVLNAANGGPVRCGPVGAVWTCPGFDGGETVTATLMAYAPHDVDPSGRVLELPIPERAG